MGHLKNIKKSIIAPNLNDGIHKAEDWWKDRQNHVIPIRLVQSSSTISTVENSGQLILTVLRAEDLYESRLSILTSCTNFVERPYVILECNYQRFRTSQSDSTSTNRNPQWTSANGPFHFNIRNSNNDRLTIWVQQHDPLHGVAHNEPKMLGTCDINVRQLIDQQQIWLPLRKYNRPVGQILVQVSFIPTEKND
ncbi:hypothetical protein I4U23_023661 [Adineta vaga]|nr:hypothetical protein I4U23_023661 [Adineta vaga]